MHGSNHSVKVLTGLPDGVVEAEVTDSTSQTVIRYRDSEQNETTFVVDPASQSGKKYELQRIDRKIPDLLSNLKTTRKELCKKSGEWCRRLVDCSFACCKWYRSH